jgi:hypothetical protein
MNDEEVTVFHVKKCTLENCLILGFWMGIQLMEYLTTMTSLVNQKERDEQTTERHEIYRKNSVESLD